MCSGPESSSPTRASSCTTGGPISRWTRPIPTTPRRASACHSILPSMMLAPDGALEMSFGCMGANMQPQGQVQILVNLIDRGFDLQQALDAPRVRALDGRRIFVERHQDQDFADKLAALGHQVVAGEEIPADWMLRHDFLRSLEGCAQAIAVAGEA